MTDTSKAAEYDETLHEAGRDMYLKVLVEALRLAAETERGTASSLACGVVSAAPTLLCAAADAIVILRAECIELLAKLKGQTTRPGPHT